MLLARNHAKRIVRDTTESRSRSDSTRVSRADQEAERQDPLRRFASTSHRADIRLMGRTVRLETNRQAILDLARSFFGSHQTGEEGGTAEFLWRIVCESDPKFESTATPLSAFSDLGFQYANIGQRCFLAVDFESREAAAFLSEQFIESAARFQHRPPLDILFCMTAPSLGLTTLSGGCVGIQDRNVLIFGPPDSGKTTACYLASRCGMEFHADHAVFLDMKNNVLRAWGDLLPAFFRPESARFLPELQRTARYSTYEEHEFYYFDKRPLRAEVARPVTPVSVLFLNRKAKSEK